MGNYEESLFYRNIKSCIEKYLPNYSTEGLVKFESSFEFSYGNSGFRDKYKTASCDLLNALSKSGILVGLLFIKHNYETIRKLKLFDKHMKGENKKQCSLPSMQNIQWKNVGVIITASHNPFDENGVKIIDCNGRQINEIYENYLTDLVNEHLRYLKKNEECTIHDIVHNIIMCISYIFEKEVNIDLFNNNIYNTIKELDDIIYNYNINNIIKGNICIGFDTRISCVHLNNIIIESLNCINIYKCINNMCFITTPCMHFVIYFLNNIFMDEKLDDTFIREKGYYTIHKEENDLDYLENFYIPNSKHIRDLYFLKNCSENINATTNELCDTHSNIDEYCKYPTKGKDNNTLKMSNPIGKCLNIPNGYSNKDVHLYAYNSDKFYFDYFTYLFEDLYNYMNKIYDEILKKTCKEEVIYVDCSNGIASLKIDNFKNIFTILKKQIIKINYIDNEKSILNFHCGAEYVYRKRKLPINASSDNVNTKFCTFDGDADRVLYFFIHDVFYDYPNGNGSIAGSSGIADSSSDNPISTEKCCGSNIAILDGPKITCLLLKCIMKMLSQIDVSNISVLSSNTTKQLDINIIHTSYVNSAFLKYINNIKKYANEQMELFQYISINIICTKTGIKYLDKIAQKSSIGILFESNGHGTIYTDINKLNEWSRSLCIEKDKSFIALKKYLLFFNQTAGDAIIDFVAIELSLSFLNLTINQWDQFYDPLPSLYINIPCPRNILAEIIPHPEHEKYLIQPLCLQREIDQVVREIDSHLGRCFIRPSGTENLIRIYAEAQTAEKMNNILHKAKDIVYTYVKKNELCP
ncbi:phosphoacetylglucosamine mutase [Plasmodium brasilianum]|uniref:Phosphoacetylglucosamine mutase, putative n=3 Tax=Plasmodium (Plasmodium) TaxID=418103 RepID=A0A1D3PCN3_PLAMA|nr:phosphoacetylglucosamine mutase, putative [Plasmodium malariae]KAI4838422.1 phosphoacetylglucosamine mutase [Plasmodium brasilianum]SCN12818.1 phosphoacetylglucosamine mutase, putative [Plasmodium malariae]